MRGDRHDCQSSSPWPRGELRRAADAYTYTSQLSGGPARGKCAGIADYRLFARDLPFFDM